MTLSSPRFERCRFSLHRYGREWLTHANVLQQSAALQQTLQHPSKGRGDSGWNSSSSSSSYKYINVDSFWANDPTKNVDCFGRWTVNTTRFPQGMKVVADAVHARNQLFGLYINPGVAVAAVKQQTLIEGAPVPNCTADQIAVKPLVGGNTFWDCYKINWTHPCAMAYITSFANHLVADIGIDFLKIDAVSPGSGTDSTARIRSRNAANAPPAPPLAGTAADEEEGYHYDNHLDVAAWSKALAATGRDVWVAISWHIPASAAPLFVGAANSWRTSDDVDCYCDTFVSWQSILRLFSQVKPWLQYSGCSNSTGRPDLDSLDVAGGIRDGLDEHEKQTAVTLWAVVGAPMYTGNDLTKITAQGIKWLTNPTVLDINAHFITAIPLNMTVASSSSSGLDEQSQRSLPEVWVADYGNGTCTVAVFNLADFAISDCCSVSLTSIFKGAGPKHGANAYDVWKDASLGMLSETLDIGSVPAHGSRLLTLTLATQ